MLATVWTYNWELLSSCRHLSLAYLSYDAQQAPGPTGLGVRGAHQARPLAGEQTHQEGGGRK